MEISIILFNVRQPSHGWVHAVVITIVQKFDTICTSYERGQNITKIIQKDYEYCP